MQREPKQEKADKALFFAQRRRHTMKEIFIAAKAAATQTPSAAGLSVSAIFTAIAAAFGKSRLF